MIGLSGDLRENLEGELGIIGHLVLEHGAAEVLIERLEDEQGGRGAAKLLVQEHVAVGPLVQERGASVLLEGRHGAAELFGQECVVVGPLVHERGAVVLFEGGPAAAELFGQEHVDVGHLVQDNGAAVLLEGGHAVLLDGEVGLENS